MDLAQKLAKLKEQQQEVEQKMLQEVEQQDQVALKVFSRFISSKPEAITAMTNSKYAQALGKKDQALFAAWVRRIDGKISTPIPAPTNDSKPATPSGSVATEKTQVSPLRL